MEKEFIKCIINNEEKKFEVMYKFKSNTTSKVYVIYTDNKEDEDGSLFLYSSIYNFEKENKLEDITDEKDWAVVEEFLNQNKDSSDE